MLTVPFIVPLLAPTMAADEWPTVFFLFAGFLIIAAMPFAFFGSGTAERYTGQSVKNSLGVDADTVSIEAGILEMKVIQPQPVA